MRFLIINTNYPEFTHWLYSKNKGLEECSYKEQLQVRMDTPFGLADFYSKNLKKLGYEAYAIIANNEILQKQWAKENGLVVSEKKGIHRTVYQIGKRIVKRMPSSLKLQLRSFFPAPTFPGFYQILAAQIKKIRPDVILNQAIGEVSSNFISAMKPYVKLLVGQGDATLLLSGHFACYDLVFCSLPNHVENLRRVGTCSELYRVGFESSLLLRLKEREKTIPVSFVGSLTPLHKKRIAFLENICGDLDIKIWGCGAETLPNNSIIRNHHMGEAWGTEMYQILGNSKVTLNKHIHTAGSFADNMRLYEATGVGTLLITDYKDNLSELFIPGKEVVAYHNPEECVELVKYYLNHEKEREEIAQAGQERTLKEYTYYQRIQELVEIINKYL